MRHMGQVKWFDDVKGYGFLVAPHGDVFVHHSAIDTKGWRTLQAGELVEFELAADSLPKRLRADKVRRLGDAQEPVVVPDEGMARETFAFSARGIIGQEIVNVWVCDTCAHAGTFPREAESPTSCPRCGCERAEVRENVTNTAAVDAVVVSVLGIEPQRNATISRRTKLPIPIVGESLLRLVAQREAVCVENGYCRLGCPAA